MHPPTPRSTLATRSPAAAQRALAVPDAPATLHHPVQPSARPRLAVHPPSSSYTPPHASTPSSSYNPHQSSTPALQPPAFYQPELQPIVFQLQPPAVQLLPPAVEHAVVQLQPPSQLQPPALGDPRDPRDPAAPATTPSTRPRCPATAPSRRPSSTTLSMCRTRLAPVPARPVAPLPTSPPPRQPHPLRPTLVLPTPHHDPTLSSRPPPTPLPRPPPLPPGLRVPRVHHLPHRTHLSIPVPAVHAARRGCQQR